MLLLNAVSFCLLILYSKVLICNAVSHTTAVFMHSLILIHQTWNKMSSANPLLTLQHYIFVCVCSYTCVTSTYIYIYTHISVVSCREIGLNYLKLVRAFYYRIGFRVFWGLVFFTHKVKILSRGFRVFSVKLLKMFPTKQCRCSVEVSPCSMWYTHNFTGSVHPELSGSIMSRLNTESLIRDVFKLKNNWLPSFCPLILEACLLQR